MQVGLPAQDRATNIPPKTEDTEGKGEARNMKTLRRVKGTYLFVLIAMGGLVASTLGILTNTAGIFFPPVADELAGGNTTGVNLTLTICNLVFAVAGILSARVLKPGNFRGVVICGTLCFALGTAALSLCHSLPAMYLVSAVRGFSAGMIGNVLATTVIGHWFKSDTGFLSSLVLACSGIAGALLNPVLEAVIRAAGWRTAYLVSAGFILLLNAPAMFFPIAFTPEKLGMEPLQGDGPAPAVKAVVSGPEGRSRVPLSLLLITLFACAFASFATAAPQLFKPLAITYRQAETGVVMMSVVLVANTVGKFLFGALTDRIGTRKSILIYGTVVSAGVILLLLLHDSVFMLISAALIGLSYSIPTVGAVMICRELYSAESYSYAFPKVNMGVTVANALGYPVMGFIYDRTGSYNGALILVLCLVVGTMVLTLAAYRRKI